MAKVDNVLRLDLTITDDNAQQGALDILHFIRPDWIPERIKFKVFTEGFTNKLLGCYQSGDVDNMVLVRVNGEGSDVVVNRDSELETFRLLCTAGCAPPVYCVFNNGIAYGFFPGQPLDERTVRLPNIQRLIAEEVVRYHGACQRNGKQHKIPVRSQYREKVQYWINILPGSFDDPDKQKVFENEIPKRNQLQKELGEIVDHLDSLGMNIVFSHNDLLLKNIIYNPQKDTVRFIDYEYAFFNYEAYDIGNHFAEWAGMAVVNYDLYPTREEQLPWLRHYLDYKAKTEGQFHREITDKDVERLYIQANSCACAAHFFWAVWALLQAKHSVIDFDYIRFASIRLSEYFRRKSEFFSMKL
ncbi:unnamed protein product [Candidula unifasciata]|uniref:ethanolamine kinase n=1 Tax=Candidula unifasciata TaxID=100452 RepID=A0A8S3ZTI0_9EUPU|nr:unnamed protein product [Candidula unifasciata]